MQCSHCELHDIGVRVYLVTLCTAEYAKKAHTKKCRFNINEANAPSGHILTGHLYPYSLLKCLNQHTF